MDHIRQLRERFPQAKLRSIYGLTECRDRSRAEAGAFGG